MSLSPYFRNKQVLNFNGQDLLDHSGVQTVPLTNNGSVLLGQKLGLGAGVASFADAGYSLWLEMTNTGNTTSNLVLVKSGTPAIIDWGDGTVEEVLQTAPGSYTSHTYSAPYTGAVRIYVNDANAITRIYSTLNHYSFDIATINASVTRISVEGSNTLSGSVAGLTNLTSLIVTGSNTLSGSVAGLTGLTYIYVTGFNTLSGSVAGLTSLTFLYVHGSNTLSGSVAGLTGLTYIYVTGSNTLAWDINDIPANVCYLIITGLNQIATYTAGHTWLATTMQYVYIAPAAGYGLDQTEVDNLLIDLAASTTAWAGAKIVWLAGNNAAPGLNGLIAKAQLEALGCTVTVTAGYPLTNLEYFWCADVGVGLVGGIPDSLEDILVDEVLQSQAVENSLAMTTMANGALAIVGDGTHDYMLTAAFAAALEQPFTIHVVCTVPTDNNAFRMLTYGLSIGTGSIRHNYDSGDDLYGIHFGNFIQNTALSAPGTEELLTAIAEEATNTDNLYRNGTLIVTGNAGAGTLAGLTIMAREIGTLPSNSKIAAVLIQSGAATAGDKAVMAAWVLSKYGITVTW